MRYGTSLPELVTSASAALKGKSDIAIGNILGSNIFNIIFILGLSSTISNLTLDWAIFTDIAVMLVAGILVLLIALFSGKTKKWQGAIMVLLYIGYIIYIIIRN